MALAQTTMKGVRATPASRARSVTVKVSFGLDSVLDDVLVVHPCVVVCVCQCHRRVADGMWRSFLLGCVDSSAKREVVSVLQLSFCVGGGRVASRRAATEM
jgi:hypothetical protein